MGGPTVLPCCNAPVQHSWPSWTGKQAIRGWAQAQVPAAPEAPLPLARALLLSVLGKELDASSAALELRTSAVRAPAWCLVGPCLLVYGSTFSLCLLRGAGGQLWSYHCCSERPIHHEAQHRSHPNPILTYWAWDSACEFWELDIQMAAFCPSTQNSCPSRLYSIPQPQSLRNFTINSKAWPIVRVGGWGDSRSESLESKAPEPVREQ